VSDEDDERPIGLRGRPVGYAEWLAEVRQRIHTAQQRATLAVNQELLGLYWQLGREILERQAREGWGAGVVDQLSADLRKAFPEMQGFSRSNLKFLRASAEAWTDFSIGQQPVGQLPWGHKFVLLTRLKTREARLDYARRAATLVWLAMPSRLRFQD
jgi:predicted nuclease of restriction endonuclease-like (RecB) superfamily